MEGVKDYVLSAVLPPSLTPQEQALMPYFTVDLRSVWSPTLIAQAVLDHCRAARLTPPLPPTLVEVVACAVADASVEGFSPAFGGLVPGLLGAVVPSVVTQARDVLGVMALVLASEVTRGYGVGAMGGGTRGLLAVEGLKAVGEVVEWMWGWVDEEGEDGEEREGREVVREAMRRMAVGWKAAMSEDECRSSGLEEIIVRMEAMSAKPRDASEWEEKRADPLQA